MPEGLPKLVLRLFAVILQIHGVTANRYRAALFPNFQFGPLIRASYASPALDTTNLPPEQVPLRCSDG
jgi:hypothetical protein